MKVQVKYTFIFEPDQNFTKKSDIDSFMAQAFEKVGYESELIKTGGNDEIKSMVYLSPIISEFDEPKEKTPRSQKFLASRKVE